MPIHIPIEIGSFLVFGGRRWKILEVDNDARVIQLTRARGGRVPLFMSDGPEIADGIRIKMRSLYGETTIPSYLSSTAQELLAEGRAAFHRLGLAHSPFLPHGRGTVIFPWRGDRIVNTLLVILKREGIDVDSVRVAITCANADQERLHALIAKLAATAPPDPIALAASVLNKGHDKHDGYLSEPLLTAAYAARSLDVPATWGALRELVAFGPNRSH
jgi:ATP-dependent Lhr-like helicase